MHDRYLSACFHPRDVVSTRHSSRSLNVKKKHTHTTATRAISASRENKPRSCGHGARAHVICPFVYPGAPNRPSSEGAAVALNSRTPFKLQQQAELVESWTPWKINIITRVERARSSRGGGPICHRRPATIDSDRKSAILADSTLHRGRDLGGEDGCPSPSALPRGHVKTKL